MNRSSRFDPAPRAAAASSPGLVSIAFAALLLGACTTVPTGPSVMALPGSGKNFDQFRTDDAQCREYALGQVGGNTPNQTAADAGVKSAAVGAAIGAVAGTAIGGSQGAGVGAGVGLLAGSVAGAGAGDASAHGLQRRYDNAYVQCMYAKGQRVPVSGRLASTVQADTATSHAVAPPPPPPGYPPPPPPGVRR